MKIGNRTPEENNTKLIELLEQIIAEVREFGAVDAFWTVDAEDCGDRPYRYRLDAVIDRGVPVERLRPFWRNSPSKEHRQR